MKVTIYASIDDDADMWALGETEISSPTDPRMAVLLHWLAEEIAGQSEPIGQQ